MTLSCPSCKSRFMIDPAVLLPKGRKVRCGFCGERWFQEPLPEVAAPEEAAAEEAAVPEAAVPEAAVPEAAGAETLAGDDESAFEETSPPADATIADAAASDTAATDTTDTAATDAAATDTAATDASPEEAAHEDLSPDRAPESSASPSASLEGLRGAWETVQPEEEPARMTDTDDRPEEGVLPDDLPDGLARETEERAPMSREERETAVSATGSDMEEPCEDDSLEALAEVDRLREDAALHDQAETPAFDASAGKSMHETDLQPSDDAYAQAAEKRENEGEPSEEADAQDDSDWDSDWRGTQPLASDSLEEDATADDEGYEGETRPGETGAELIERDYGVRDSESASAAKPESEEKGDLTSTPPPYDAAEALFGEGEEEEQSGLGIYGDQDDDLHWDDLEKAPESESADEAERESDDLAGPYAAGDDDAAESDVAAGESSAAGLTAAESGKTSDAVPDTEAGVYGGPSDGEPTDGEDTAGAAAIAGPESDVYGATGDEESGSDLFARKGTSRTTLLSQEVAEPGQTYEDGQESGIEPVQKAAGEIGTDATDMPPSPAADAPAQDSHDTVYADAGEPGDAAETYDPGAALEEVAAPDEPEAQPARVIASESKPIKTMSDYLVAAVDDDDTPDKEEDWGVSELESFFRDSSDVSQKPEAKADSSAAAAAQPQEAGTSEAPGDAVLPEELEGAAQETEGSKAARAKFRRILAAGATAAAANEAASNRSDAQGTAEKSDAEKESSEEDGAAQIIAVQARGAGGSGLARGWALYFSTLLAIGSVFYFGRERLVDFEPRMTELYKLLGL